MSDPSLFVSPPGPPGRPESAHTGMPVQKQYLEDVKFSETCAMGAKPGESGKSGGNSCRPRNPQDKQNSANTSTGNSRRITTTADG